MAGSKGGRCRRIGAEAGAGTEPLLPARASAGRSRRAAGPRRPPSRRRRRRGRSGRARGRCGAGLRRGDGGRGGRGTASRKASRPASHRRRAPGGRALVMDGYRSSTHIVSDSDFAAKGRPADPIVMVRRSRQRGGGGSGIPPGPSGVGVAPGSQVESEESADVLTAPDLPCIILESDGGCEMRDDSRHRPRPLSRSPPRGLAPAKFRVCP